MQLKTAIPHIYYTLAASGAAASGDMEKARHNKNEKFKAYVKAYAMRTYPGWNYVRIEGNHVILEQQQ